MGSRNDLLEQAGMGLKKEHQIAKWEIEIIMNTECKRIFDECRTVSEKMKGRGIFPNTAIIVCDSSIDSDKMHFPEIDCEGLFFWKIMR